MAELNHKTPDSGLVPFGKVPIGFKPAYGTSCLICDDFVELPYPPTGYIAAVCDGCKEAIKELKAQKEKP